MTEDRAAASRPVGIFDSGVGGLSVWREIARQLPQESTIYVADQAHVPFGPRPATEILGYAEGITRFLIEQNCKTIVVACNTASAVALQALRDTHPGLPFVGMEPAVKPAAARTKTGVVGIMATPATFEGELFRATAGRHANGIRIINQICAGLAEHVESGAPDDPQDEALLRPFIEPMLDAGADTIVLACTHYPFVLEAIRRIAGPGVEVIDPAPAVARQLERVLVAANARSASPASHRFMTTGDPARFSGALRRLLQLEAPAQALRWRNGRLLQER